MSTINRKPFIKTLLESCTDDELSVLSSLLDGSGDQTIIKRSANPVASSNAPHISATDKGVKLCNLTINYTSWLGYLIYTDDYCVLISFTDAQVLKMFDLTADKTIPNTVDEELNILELRSTLYEVSGGSGSSGGGSGGSGIVEVELPEITLSDLVFNSEDNSWICANADFLNGIELLKQRKVVSLQHHISYEYGEQDNSSSFSATVCNEAFESGNLFSMPLFGLSLNGVLSDGTNTMVAFLGDGEELARAVIFSLQDMSNEFITNLINFSFTLKYYYFE